MEKKPIKALIFEFRMSENWGEVNWMAALNGYYLIRNVPTNYSQHYYILTDFFNKGLQTLQNWDSTQEKKHTTKEMAMAMMYGLDTVDANCPQSYIDNINTAFDLLKKQFNISDTELNDFNKSQLVSIFNLPNSGCN